MKEGMTVMDNPEAALTLTACYDAVDTLIARFASGECAHWRCIRGGGARLCPWDDPVHQGRVVIKMSGSTPYIVRFVTIEWDKSNIHLTQQDEKTGALDDSWDIPIPEAWLRGMKAVSWPPPPEDEAPWF
jgi:hypothetical protein